MKIYETMSFLRRRHISKSEMDFLLEIKAEAKSAVKLLDELIAECQTAIK